MPKNTTSGDPHLHPPATATQHGIASTDSEETTSAISVGSEGSGAEPTCVVTWVEVPDLDPSEEVLICVKGEEISGDGRLVASFQLQTTLDQWDPREFLIREVSERGFSITSLHVDLNFAEVTYR